MIKKKLHVTFLALILSLCFIVSLILSSSGVYAAAIKDMDKVIIDPLGGEVLVYFDSQHKNEIKNFISVNEDMNCFGASTKIDSFIFRKPDASENYNSMDYVVYMINELDKLAMSYTNRDRRKANNCVLGYIRGINKDYAGKDEKQKDPNDKYDGIEWKVVCGPIDKGFISFVATKEKADEITFPEFFASFLQNASNYNSFLHGAIDEVYLNKAYKVPDPLGTGQSIDLIHMFAAMDGIYEYTDENEFICYEAFGTKYFQKDLVSWLGDLQQLTNSVSRINWFFKDYELSDGYIDFNIRTGGSGFSSDDFLADLDAFNITKFFVDCEKNSIANAFYGYYNSINKNKATKGNRFYEFIYTVTLELEQNNQSSILDNFRTEICSSLNIKYNNGVYSDYKYYIPSDLIRQNMKVLCEGDIYPLAKTRAACAKLFCDYVIALSGGR